MNRRRRYSQIAALALLATGVPDSLAAALKFREASAAWGLTFQHRHGGTGEFYMPETMGSGVVIFDADGDGDEDVFFVDSGALPGPAGSSRSRLFRNEGSGFRDVTADSGIKVSAYGMGGVAADVDGDGDLDLYLTAFGANQLFTNNGDGTFTDTTARAGVGDPLWSSSAAFADTDRDGDLDLYVANYVDFAIDRNQPCGNPRLGLRSYCHPEVYRGLPHRYYRNRGSGTFEDASAAAGFAGAVANGMGVVFGDLDGDGWEDLYVANDMNPAFLFRNRGNGSFEELGLLSGTALSDQGLPEAGMGVDLGDVDGNGLPDIVKTHLDLQGTALYLNQGGLIFTDGRYTARLAQPSLHMVGFGTQFGDFDQDGDVDLVCANGHIIHNVEAFGTGSTYRQRNQIFENVGRGVFAERRDSGLDIVRSSRGLATGDLDGDGDLDLVITNSNDLAEVYANDSDGGAFLQLELRGRGGNTAAIGARVELQAGPLRAVRAARTGGSYQSQSALGLHFGLGNAGSAGRILVRWPYGRVTSYSNLPANHRYLVVE